LLLNAIRARSGQLAIHLSAHMKILWLSHLVPYPPKGGVLQRSYHLLRETARTNEVTLLAFNQSDLMARRFPTVRDGLREAKQALSEFCTSVEFFPIPAEEYPLGKYFLALASLFTRAPYTVNWLHSSHFRSHLKHALESRNYDTVHFDTISLAPYIRLLSSCPTVLDHHNIESHMMLRRAELESNFLKKSYFLQEGHKLARYERQVCPLFDLHITCSELDSERLQKIAPHSRIEEVPNGVDIGYFSPTGNEPLPNSLVFAGGLNWYPNQQAMQFFADEIWPRLKQRIPTVTMDVIGEAPPESLCRVAAVDSNFRVHGFVDDVRPYLDRAAAYVCPISDGGGTKLKILDAFAMAKATVAHPIACEGISATPGRNVLFAISPDEYVDQIVLLLENPVLRREIGNSARQLILNHYSYESIGAKLRELFLQVGQRGGCA
jgi:polysaccharide biosynthesis protein PslH